MQDYAALAEYIERAKAQDEAAFAYLYEQTYSIVYNIACAALQNEEEAKDVVSEVFIRVYRGLPALQNNRSFIAWLTVITKNVCIDHRAKWRPEVDSFPLPGDPADENDPIAEWQEKEALRTLMQKLICQLPEVQQRAVYCVYFKQLSIGQTAALEGCSINTIKTRLFYARDTLRQAILAEEKRTGDKFHLPMATVALSAIMALPNVGFTLAPEEAAQILASVFTALGVQYTGERAAPFVTVIHEEDGDEPHTGRFRRRSYLVKLRPLFLSTLLVLALASILLVAGISYTRGRQTAAQPDPLPVQTPGSTQSIAPPTHTTEAETTAEPVTTAAPATTAPPVTTAAPITTAVPITMTAPISTRHTTVDGVIYSYTIENRAATISDVILTESASTAVTVPAALDGWPVTEISWHAFENNTTITAVTIPDSVTTLGMAIFWGCTALEQVVLPASIDTIYHGNYSPSATAPYTYGGPFMGWPNAKTAGPIGSGCNIEFAWTTTIPGFVFAGCTNLTSVIIPDTVDTLGGYLFSRCESLTQITLPTALKGCIIKAPAFEDGQRVNGGPFAGWPNAKTVGPVGSGCNIEFAGTHLPTHLFYGCTTLTSVTIPDTVTQLGGFLFHDCTALEKVVVPASVKTVYQSRFTIDTVSYAGSVFAGWPNAKTAGPIGSGCNIEFAWTNIPGFTFWGCTALEQVTIPDTVTTLGAFLFADCTALEQVVIASSICKTPYMGSNYWGSMESGAAFARWPNAITAGPIGSGCNIEFAWEQVPSSAFLGCTALTSVTFPATLRTLGGAVFDGCTALKQLTFAGDAPALTEDTLRGLDAAVLIRCPSAASGWDAKHWKAYQIEEYSTMERAPARSIVLFCPGENDKIHATLAEFACKS